MSADSDAAREFDGGRSTRVFGPPASVVIGTLVAMAIFVVVLEFLVIISFVGQRLWTDPRLAHDAVFTLPLLIWVGIAVTAVIITLRVLTAWIQIDENGFRLRALGRRTREADWDQVGRVIAVRDIDRGRSPTEMLEAAENAYDGVYVMDREDHRLLAVSSRFFGPRAQRMALRRAEEAGVHIDYIEAMTAAELREHAPQALSYADRHPSLILLLVAAFYLFHNVLTFAVWGL